MSNLELIEVNMTNITNMTNFEPTSIDHKSPLASEIVLQWKSAIYTSYKEDKA